MPVGTTQGHTCVVPGCTVTGKNKLGVRCRVWHDGPSPVEGKGRTAALWAPDSDAYLCDAHAMGGGHVTILFEPDGSEAVTVKVLAAATVDEKRSAIRQS
jgi:hypothetical protein